jgi:hypothetical protein
MSDDSNDKGAIGSILTELGIVPPDRGRGDHLTVDQQEVIAAYRSGRMGEEEFQRRLAADSAIAEYVRRLPDETPDRRPAV